MRPAFEPGDAVLLQLSALQPDAARSARTRARCRAAVQRRLRVPDRAVSDRSTDDAPLPLTPGARAWRRGLAGIAGLLCLLYVLSLIATTVRLQATMP